jgi:hypothetical protein
MIPVMMRRFRPSPFAVSNKQLTTRPVQLRDASLSNATLIPLFGAAGETAKVVLLSPRTKECWVMDWRPELVAVPLLRRARVDIVRTARLGATVGEPLWLYDRSGLLELALTNLCPGLSVRNAADLLPETVQSLTWRRDLSQITGAWTKDKSGSWKKVKWKPEWLADADKPPATATPVPRPVADRAPPPKAKMSGGWVLAPMWAR